MGTLISNQPIGCSFCGYGPIIGQESQYETWNKIIKECRWTCPRCYNLVRLDEDTTDKTEDKTP
jgi:hypothetical protein